MRQGIVLYINGERHEIAEEAGWMLADYLRYQKRLTGTKIVCAEGDCGACSVLRYFPYAKNREFVPVNSCITTMAQLDGSSLVTVDALKGETLHPVQTALKDCHGSQCGFCTPGFVVALTGLVEKKISCGENAPLTEKEAKNALTGNLCRCTGYQPILDAARAIEVKNCASVKARYFSQAQDKDLRKTLGESALVRGEGFELYAPKTIKDAAKYLAKNKRARLLAAATDLGVAHNKGKIQFERVLSLHLVKDLYALSLRAKGKVKVGARVSLHELRDALQEKAPEFSRFLDLFASPQIKNIATLVGNVANASPIADTPPFLFLCDAVVEAFGPKGERAIPFTDFYLGYRHTALRAGEMITAISFTLPPPADTWALYKISERKDLDISCVNAGIRLSWTKEKNIADARVAFGGVAATPLRLRRTEAVLRGQKPSAELLAEAAAALQEEIRPLSDVRGSAAFRRVLAGNLFAKFFREHVGAKI